MHALYIVGNCPGTVRDILDFCSLSESCTDDHSFVLPSWNCHCQSCDFNLPSVRCGILSVRVHPTGPHQVHIIFTVYHPCASVCSFAFADSLIPCFHFGANMAIRKVRQGSCLQLQLPLPKLLRVCNLPAILLPSCVRTQAPHHSVVSTNACI